MLEEFLAEERSVFEELQRKLGIEYNVQDILNAKDHTKLANYTNLHKDVEKRNKNFKGINSGLKERYEEVEGRKEESARRLKEFREKCE